MDTAPQMFRAGLCAILALVGGLLLSMVLPALLAPPNGVMPEVAALKTLNELPMSLEEPKQTPTRITEPTEVQISASPAIPVPSVTLPPLLSTTSMAMDAIAFSPAAVKPLANFEMGAPSEGLSLAQVDEPPRMLHYVAPKARQHGAGGKIMLRLLVTETGSVADIQVLNEQAVDSTELDGAVLPALAKAAVTAARKWRFKPAQLNGQAVKVFVDVPINFSGS